MRKVILWMGISLDGFIEGPDGDIGWHQVDEELHTHFNDELRTMGAFLEGRRTYELMEGYWPTADADPSAPAPVRDFAGIWRDMPKIVYSRTLREAGPNATIVRDVVADEVRELTEARGGDLCLGGANLAASFRDLDLIDEYRIYVHPVVIGRGTPLFRETSVRTPLELAETRPFGNGVVLLRHVRKFPRRPQPGPTP